MDLLPNNVCTGKSSDNYIKFVLYKLYNLTKLKNNCFCALNIGWPKFNLPSSFDSYTISFHTEYVAVDWLLTQAKKVFPKPILLITDYKIHPNEIWPSNIKFVQIISIHKQLDLARHIFGVNLKIHKPTYKLSSLSMRINQYKRFVTAYLLQHFEKKDVLLSYHNVLGKAEDLHDFPSLPHLDTLNLNLEKILVNIHDESDIINVSPIENTNWRIPAFVDALFNLTNESFNYSATVKNNQHFVYPGPYFTDKTFKPLLAGRPFIPVGQAGSVKFLQDIGFKTDFGIDMSFDNDIGDLTRIKGVFNAIDTISSKSLDELYERSIQSCIHNSKHILSGNLDKICADLNKPGLDTIRSWHA